MYSQLLLHIKESNVFKLCAITEAVCTRNSHDVDQYAAALRCGVDDINVGHGQKAGFPADRVWNSSMHVTSTRGGMVHLSMLEVCRVGTYFGLAMFSSAARKLHANMFLSLGNPMVNTYMI